MKTSNNVSHNLNPNLTQPDRPLPAKWRHAARELVRTKVTPALHALTDGQAVVVTTERRKSPQLEIARLPSEFFPWVARVILNTDTVMFVARRTLRLVHNGVTYQSSR